MRGLAGIVLAIAFAAAPSARAAEPARCEPQPGKRLVGYVVALSGSAWARDVACEGERRLLVCGDLVFEGERVTTSGNARIGLLAQGLRIEIGADSDVLVNLTPSAAPDLALAEGRLRAGGALARSEAAWRVAAGGFEAEGLGNDVEIEMDGVATFCEHAKPLALRRPGARAAVTLAPDRCAVVRADDPPVLEEGRLPQLARVDTDRCAGDIGSARDYFDPFDVGAARSGLELPPPGDDDAPEISCTIAPDLCLRPPDPPPVPPAPPVVPPSPPPVVESPPVFRPPPGLPVRNLPRN